MSAFITSDPPQSHHERRAVSRYLVELTFERDRSVTLSVPLWSPADDRIAFVANKEKICLRIIRPGAICGLAILPGQPATDRADLSAFAKASADRRSFSGGWSGLRSARLGRPQGLRHETRDGQPKMLQPDQVRLKADATGIGV
jgi:hypothetical protein